MAGASPGFCSMKQLRVLLPAPSRDGMLVHCRVTPSSVSLVTILYAWVEREMAKETTRWQGLGVEPPTYINTAASPLYPYILYP